MRPGLFTMPAGDPRVSRAVAALAHGEGQFLLPMFAAVAQGLGLVVVQDRETSPSALHRALDAVREPAALILDGDDYRPGAPSDWRCGRAALDWARVALVHGAAGEREHYEAAVLAAALTGRLLIVHCSSGEATAWAERTAAARLCPLVITPRPGVVHPQPMAPTGPIQ